MSEKTDESSEVYNYYLELSKPTEEDFKRVFTEEELKQLCLRHKSRVDMWRWNVVNEYREIFTKSGRFQRWSERHRIGMLAKAVNKMKPSILYDDEEIKKIRREEWQFQLKENILSLRYWERQRLAHPSLVVSESVDIDEEVQSQCVVNTDSMNVDELFTQSEEQQYQLGIEVHTESMNVAELLTQSEKQECQQENDLEQQYQLEIEVLQNSQSQEPANPKLLNEKERIVECIRGGPIISSKVAPAKSLEEDILVANFEADYSIEGDSEDSVDTVLDNEHYKIVVTETLQSQEIASEIKNIYDINTLSMSIESQISAQSEDVIPQNYDNFKDIIPLTSTQSQNHEMEL